MPRLEYSFSIPLLAFFCVSAISIFSIATVELDSDERGKFSTLRLHNSDKMPKIVVASRIHKASALTMTKISKVVNFIQNCNEYANRILLCVDLGHESSNRDYIDELSSEIARGKFADKVEIVVVSPWGQFTPALNAALSKAIERGYEWLIFQSIEFEISKGAVDRLTQYMVASNDTLVVGPAMAGHEFSPGYNRLTGRACPWNTFAIWNVRLLGLTGFPMIGDAFGEAFGGVEEVSTISLLQKLKPSLVALLVRIRGVRWDTVFTDPEREKYHVAKMQSKNERPAKQLEILGLEPGRVLHLDDLDK